MNPRKAECLGRYLYGAGFYSRDDNTLGLISGTKGTPPHFCLSCPARGACEDEHEHRVRELLPEESELFDQQMRQAVQRGIPATLAAVRLGSRGLDPYAKVAADNFTRGHADRGRISGTLVK